MDEYNYPALLTDMSGFTLNTFLPKTVGIFEPFANLPVAAMLGGGAMFSATHFTNPEILNAVKELGEAAGLLIPELMKSAAFEAETIEMAFRLFYE